MGRNAADRSGTLAPAAEEVRISSEECGPNANTRGLGRMSSTGWCQRWIVFDKTFRPRPEVLSMWRRSRTRHESAREE